MRPSPPGTGSWTCDALQGYGEHVGPLWSLRCTHCQRKCKVTFWLLPLNVMTALAVGFFVLNSYIKVNDRLLDISPMLAIPAVLMLDLCLRFYVFKLQKK